MTQEFVTLPREVVEQAISTIVELEYSNSTAVSDKMARDSKAALRAALDQPQDHIEQHLGMVPAGWRLVPVTPTPEMIRVMCAYDGTQYSNTFDSDDFKEDYRNMLAAAPQPQANQPAMTPIAQRKLDDLLADGYTISGYSIYHEQKHQHGFVTGAGLVGWWRPDGMEYPQPQVEQEPVGEAGSMPGTDGFTMACFRASDVPVGTKLYTRPQPKREPLTDKAIGAIIKSNFCEITNQNLYDAIYLCMRDVEGAHEIEGQA